MRYYLIYWFIGLWVLMEIYFETLVFDNSSKVIMWIYFLSFLNFSFGLGKGLLFFFFLVNSTTFNFSGNNISQKKTFLKIILVNDNIKEKNNLKKKKRIAIRYILLYNTLLTVCRLEFWMQLNYALE